jgi:hypothetical protein
MTEVRRTTLALIGLRKLAEKVSQLGEFRRNRMLVSARPDEDPAHARCAGPRCCGASSSMIETEVESSSRLQRRALAAPPPVPVLPPEVPEEVPALLAPLFAELGESAESQWLVPGMST